MTAIFIPLILASVAIYAMSKKVDLFDALTSGARESIGVLYRILPSLVALLSAVYMLRASGALEILVDLLGPLTDLVGISREVVPLMLIRPLSGSGALAVASEIISAHGADSMIGRTAAVMLGSSETTFYAVGIYFGSVGIKKSRHAVPAALIGDVAGAIMAALVVKIWFYMI